MAFVSVGGGSIYASSGVGNTTPFGNSRTLTDTTSYGLTVSSNNTLSFSLAGDYTLVLSSKRFTDNCWKDVYVAGGTIPIFSVSGGVTAKVSGYEGHYYTGAYCGGFHVDVHVTGAGTIVFSAYSTDNYATDETWCCVWDIRERPWHVKLAKDH